MNVPNFSNLFCSAADLSDRATIGKIAINENGEAGFIACVKTIGAAKIYVGIDLAKGTEWVSLVPQVFNTKINLRTAMEMFLILQDAKKEELKSRLDISISPPLGPDSKIEDPSTWKKITIDPNTAPEDFQSLLEKFLFPYFNNPEKNNYSEDDFKFDNEEEDKDNF